MALRAVIDRIVSDSAAPLFKAAGYRKRRRSFHKPGEGLYRVASFQASQRNDSESASFTLNVGLAVPGFHEALTGRPFPANPASAADVLTKRIGYLFGDRDVWWKVETEEDVASVGATVQGVVRRYALPFLERFSDLGSLRPALDRKEGSAVSRAIHIKCLAWIHARDGRADEARLILLELSGASRVPTFRENVEVFADRIGVSLSDQ